jgi:hypothetical protein
MLRLLTGHWISQAVYIAAKLRIADLVAGGPVTAEHLATATGTHPPSLYRLLRALASIGVFSEPSPGSFTLTALAEFLRSDTPGSLRALAIILNEVQYRAWGNLLETIRTGEPAFEREVQMPLFEYYARNPEVGSLFNDAMVNYTTGVARAAVSSYDFSPFSTIVDVGGGYGHLLATVLKSNANARGILFDLPHVIEGAREFVLRSGISDRCTLVPGDFFQEDLPDGGDLYILAGVLHDWDDRRALDILRQCRRATDGTGTVLVIDLVLPGGDEPSFGKWLDLHMLAMSGGRERTAKEFEDLFREAGLQMTQLVPTSAGPSVVAGRPV